MQENELIHGLQEDKVDAFEVVFRNYYARQCLFAEHILKDMHAVKQ